MSACIWYISKYVAVPAARMGGTRAFMLMREMVRMGHRCVILTSDSNHLTASPEVKGTVLREAVEGVDILWIRTLKYLRPGSVMRVLSWLDFEWRLWSLPKQTLPRPDAVIVSSLSLLTILNGLWLKRIYGCRLVFEVRDIWPLTLVCEANYSRYHPAVLFLGLLERLGYRHSDAVVGTMPNLREHVAALVGPNVPVHCVPMGIDPLEVEEPSLAHPDDGRGDLVAGKFTVAYAGGMGVANSLEILFKCAQEMQLDEGVHFLVMGTGSLKVAFQEQYGALPNLTFVPYKAKDEVHSWLTRCDLLLFTTDETGRWRFGQSLNKIIDYMLAARPIIGVYSGYPSMLNEAECGTFVPPRDTAALRHEILRYSRMTAADRNAIGAAGRAWLLRHRTYRTLAREYLQIALPGSESRPSEDTSEGTAPPRPCIWYVSKYVALPNANRGGTRAFRLMREMVKMGCRGVILTSDSNHLTISPVLTGPHLTEEFDGIDVHWIRTHKYKLAKSIGRALSWLDFEWRLWRLPKGDLPRPDVVIVSSLSLLTILNGLWLKRRYQCRLVFEVRDIWPLTIVEEGGFNSHNPLVMGLSALEKLAYLRADVIVGTMPNLLAHVDQVASAHGPVHCIPFGVDDDMVDGARPLPEQWAEEHIPKGRFVVGYAGTIGITNALETLLDCARAMLDNSTIHFLVIGEGDMKADYQVLSADLTNITWASAVPKDQVQAALTHCDLLYYSVHESKVWDYGMSLNKVIDYMLAAKPVVASYSGYPTMVEEAGAGTIVKAGDAEALQAEILCYAAMPPETRHAMGEAGRAWLLRERSYQKLATDYLDLALPRSVAD